MGIAITVIVFLLFMTMALFAIYGLLERLYTRVDNFCSALLRILRDREDEKNE